MSVLAREPDAHADTNKDMGESLFTFGLFPAHSEVMSPPLPGC